MDLGEHYRKTSIRKPKPKPSGRRYYRYQPTDDPSNDSSHHDVGVMPRSWPIGITTGLAAQVNSQPEPPPRLPQSPPPQIVDDVVIEAERNATDWFYHTNI